MSTGRRGPSDLEAKRNAGTCLAMAALLSVGGGLFALVVVIMPDLLMAVAFVGGLGGLVLLHYLTWGRWMSRPRPGDVLDDDDDPRQDRGFPDPYADGSAGID